MLSDDRPLCTICEQDEQQQVEAVVYAPVNGVYVDLCKGHKWQSDNRLAESRYDGPSEITGEPTHREQPIDGCPTVTPPADASPTEPHVNCPACGAPRQIIRNATYEVFCEACRQPFIVAPHSDFSWTRAYRGIEIP